MAEELQVFGNDARKGKLMFFCTCPYVHASNMVTTFDIAKEIVHDHVPNAVCIVVHGGGVHAIYSAQRPEEQDYLTGMGRIMFENSEASKLPAKQGHTDLSIAHCRPVLHIAVHFWALTS